ncbi:hypothetical protein ACQKND_11810 [Viridibacillus arvi]|uniref:hypothetical protein n=1 Tax=Viridibacillus arvi TaxID=263475 RepID=UPI003CFEB238
MYVLNIENMFSAVTETTAFEERDQHIMQQKKQLFRYFLSRTTTLTLKIYIHVKELKRLVHPIDPRGNTIQMKKIAYQEYELIIPLSSEILEAIHRNEEVFIRASWIRLLNKQNNVVTQFQHGVVFYETPNNLPAVDFFETSSEPVYLDICNESAEDIVKVQNAAHIFNISNCADDYSVATQKTAKTLAKSLFHYPFYIHFDAYDYMKEDLLDTWQQQQIHSRDSKRTVLTMSGFRIYHAKVPAFSLTIHDDATLEKVFKELYFLPAENETFIICQNEQLEYLKDDPFVNLNEDEIIIGFSHDAQGCMVYSNKDSFCDLIHIKKLIPNSMIVQVN